MREVTYLAGNVRRAVVEDLVSTKARNIVEIPLGADRYDTIARSRTLSASQNTVSLTDLRSYSLTN